MRMSNILSTAVNATMDSITDIYSEPTVKNYRRALQCLIDIVEKDWGCNTAPLNPQFTTIGGVDSISTEVEIIYPVFSGGYRSFSLNVWLNDDGIDWDLVL